MRLPGLIVLVLLLVPSPATAGAPPLLGSASSAMAPPPAAASKAAPAAPAAAPHADADGTWHVDIVLPLSVPALRTLLADPITAARFSPDVSSIAYVARGPCDTLRVQTGPLFVPISFDMLRCSTPDGWRETLLTSHTLERYDVSWRLTPVDAATTRVSYSAHITPVFPVPAGVFEAHMQASLTTLFTRLYAATGGA